MRRQATRPEELDALPVGSIVIDIAETNAPVIACKAARGDWAVMGDDPLRRWWGFEMLRGAKVPLDIVYVPGDLPAPARIEAVA